MSVCRKYQPIDENYRKEKEQLLVETINKDFKKEEIEPGFNKFEVCLQDTTFITALTEEEIEKAAALTFDILEELKNLNNEGADGVYLRKLGQEVKAETNDGDVIWMISLWNKLATDRLQQLVVEASVVCRVGGAWALFIANPMLINVILVVYEKLVDNFDDEEFYMQCAYFLMRGIMKMHSSEVSN